MELPHRGIRVLKRQGHASGSRSISGGAYVAVSLSSNARTERTSKIVAQCVGPTKFDMWFASARFQTADQALKVTVPTRFAAEWIKNHFREALADAAAQLIAPGAKVVIQHDTDLPTPQQTDTPAQQQPAARQASATAPPAQRPGTANPAASKLRYRLDDFVVGSCNELAYTAAQRLVDEPEAPLNPLFIHGTCGLGKTHILQGLCRRFIERHPEARWRYTTAEAFTNQYIAAVQAGKLGAFRRRLRGLDLLVVDDVHFLSNKSKTQTEFLHTFDAIDLHGAKLVLASDAHPKLIREFSEALVSRFMSGMVVRIDAPDPDTRRRLIVALARRRHLTLHEAAVDMLAEHPAASVRELEGMMTKLSALASLHPSNGQPIGASMVRQIITPSGRGGSRQPIPLKRIIEVVCDHLSVDIKQVLDRCRHRRVVLARSLIIYLARQLTTLSYPELARGLSRPNHSSIITAYQRISRQIAERAPLPPDPVYCVDRIDLLAESLHRAVV